MVDELYGVSFRVVGVEGAGPVAVGLGFLAQGYPPAFEMTGPGVHIGGGPQSKPFTF